MRSKNIGRFYVTFDFVEKAEASKILSLMEFVPFRVEALYHLQCFEYIGHSPLFSEVQEGCVYPEYKIELSDNCITARRI